jgi:hypothetical protein
MASFLFVAQEEHNLSYVYRGGSSMIQGGSCPWILKNSVLGDIFSNLSFSKFFFTPPKLFDYVY